MEFDDLFALRISLLDSYDDETDIIRALRDELLYSGIHSSEINEYLKNFYDAFGIAISSDIINQAIQNSLEHSAQNIVSRMFSSIHENTSADTSAGAGASADTSAGAGTSADAVASILSILGGSGMGGSGVGGSEDGSDNNTDDDDMPGLEPMSVYQMTFHNLNTGLPYVINFYSPSDNILPQFTDVTATLGTEELLKLNKYTSTKKHDHQCTVCISDMEVGEELCELPCSHTFHNECIEPWLKTYNYKCPVCRTEVGKPTFDNGIDTIAQVGSDVSNTVPSTSHDDDDDDDID